MIVSRPSIKCVKLRGCGCLGKRYGSSGQGRYMGWSAFANVTVVIKTVVCSSSFPYQTDSIECCDSGGLKKKHDKGVGVSRKA